ncbi:hypothetical protein PAMP_012916 [Pampus punctatissimus]
MSGYSKKKKKKNGIPDRWLDYTAVGKRLYGTRFIAFKVPLKHDVPDSLLCVKIFTAGHEIPSDDTILSFKRVVRRFLHDNADNDKLIGVHCTHGLNRTGYLICRYLIDVDGMDPEEAVELFNSSRGHDIERQNYLEDLHCGPKRSNDGMEESEQEPQRGHAVSRPSYALLESDSREPRSRHCRSFPPRGTDHGSHHLPTHDGLLPRLPLLPHPPFHPPAGASFNPHERTPHPDSQWRRLSHSEDSRSRYLPLEPQWSRASHLRGDRRRSPLHHQHHQHHHHHQHHPPPPPHLPRYSARWTNMSDGYSGADDWAGPTMRHQYRYSHRDY